MGTDSCPGSRTANPWESKQAPWALLVGAPLSIAGMSDTSASELLVGHWPMSRKEVGESCRLHRRQLLSRLGWASVGLLPPQSQAKVVGAPPRVVALVLPRQASCVLQLQSLGWGAHGAPKKVGPRTHVA